MAEDKYGIYERCSHPKCDRVASDRHPRTLEPVCAEHGAPREVAS